VFLPDGLRSVEIYNHWAALLNEQAATIATLRAALDECRRLADPGTDSDAPTDGRGQRLNWIWKTARAALATAKETP
jgi:hypothetical protein